MCANGLEKQRISTPASSRTGGQRTAGHEWRRGARDAADGAFFLVVLVAMLLYGKVNGVVPAHYYYFFSVCGNSDITAEVGTTAPLVT